MSESFNLKIGETLTLDRQTYRLAGLRPTLKTSFPVAYFDAENAAGEKAGLFLAAETADGRPELFSRLADVVSPDLLRVRQAGTCALPNGQKAAYLLTALPEGGNLAAKSFTLDDKIKFLNKGWVQQIADGLNALHQNNLSAGGERWDAENLFFIDEQPTTLSPGAFFFTKNDSPENRQADFLQFGYWLMNELYPEKAKNKAAIEENRQRLKPVFAFDAKMGRLNLLIEGLMLQNAENRWGFDEVSRWLAGEDVAVVYMTAAEARIRPIEIDNAVLRTPEDVALFFQNQPKAYDKLVRDANFYDRLLIWYESLTDESGRRVFDKFVQFYKQDGAALAAEAIARFLSPLRPIAIQNDVLEPEKAASVRGFTEQFLRFIEKNKALLNAEILRKRFIAFELAVWSLSLRDGLKKPDYWFEICEKAGLKPKPTFDDRIVTVYSKINDEALLDLFYALNPQRGFVTAEGQRLAQLPEIQSYFKQNAARWKSAELQAEKNAFLRHNELAFLLSANEQAFIENKLSATVQTEVEMVDVEDWEGRTLVRFRWKQFEKKTPWFLTEDKSFEAELAAVNPMRSAAAVEEFFRQTAAGHNVRTVFRFTPVLNGHSAAVNGLDFSPDGQFLITASDDNTTKLWDISRGTVLRSFAGHQRGVVACAFHPCGLAVAASGRNNLIQLHETFTGKKIGTCSGHADRAVAIAFSPDGELMATGGYDTQIKTWQPLKAKPLKTYKTHWSYINDLAFSPEGSRLVSVGKDLKIAVLHAESGQEIAAAATGAQQNAEALCVAFHPSGDEVVTGLANGQIVFWTTNKLTPVRTFAEHKAAVHALCLSPDGRWLASVDAAGKIILWELETGETQVFQTENNAEAKCAQFNKQSSLFAVGDAKGKAYLFAVKPPNENPKIDWALLSDEQKNALSAELGQLLSATSQASRILMERRAAQPLPAGTNAPMQRNAPPTISANKTVVVAEKPPRIINPPVNNPPVAPTLSGASSGGSISSKERFEEEQERFNTQRKLRQVQIAQVIGAVVVVILIILGLIFFL